MSRATVGTRMVDVWRNTPTGVPISTALGERVGTLRWRFGCELHRVWFADHRSGWSGINLHLYFFGWNFCACVVRWKSPPRASVVRALTLREQVNAAHGDRWAAYDAAMAVQEAEAQALVELQAKMVYERIRRSKCAGEAVSDGAQAEDSAGD